MTLRALAVLLLASSQAFSAITYSRILNIGSKGLTSINAMTVDAAGNVYLTGATTSTDFPTTPGVLQPNLAAGLCSTVFDPHSPPLVGPCQDVFVVKMNSDGNIVFSTFLGGSGADMGYAIAVDASGAIYVAGRTLHQTGGLNDFPTTPGAAYSTQSTAQQDAFVAKLNSTGTALLYSTMVPGAGHGTVGLAIDASGNAYFGGNALPQEHAFPTTPGAFQLTAAADSIHSVVLKLNPSGTTVLYSTYVTGSNDYLEALAIDPGGNVYLAGESYSRDYPVTAGSWQTVPGQFYTAYVSKLNATGSALVYATYLGGPASTSNTIRIDSAGNAIVLGTGSVSSVPTTAGAFETGGVASWAINTLSRSFVAKLNSQGSGMVYATYFDGAASLDADASGNAFVTGQAGYGFPVSPGASQRCAANSQDSFAAQLDAQGTLRAASYLGGSGGDTIYRSALGPDGSVSVVGTTSSPDFPGVTPSGATGVFVTKMMIGDPNRPDAPCMARILQNSASFTEGPVSPGELVTLRGLAFGPSQGTTSGGQSFPAQLGGVRVFFDNLPAPLLYVQSQQINVQVPWELAGQSTTQVHVEYNGLSSNAATISLSPSSVGVFTGVFNQDGTRNSSSNAAKRGSVVTVYGTGAGPLNQSGASGGLWPLAPLSGITLTTSIKIGPLDAEVTYSGSAPFQSSGVFQINTRVPDTLFPNDSYGIFVRIGDSSNAFACCPTIAVQ